jgi:release factor glutamine methyltransferase
MSPKELLNFIAKNILVYDQEEANEIAFLLLQNKFSISKNDLVFSEKNLEINSDFTDNFLERINAHEPIQYILNQAWFLDRPFYVDKSVLIPRPETEEIIGIAKKIKPKTAIDLGTGSGCIAISLKKEIKECETFAIDISEEAIAIARRNIFDLNVKVSIEKANILHYSNPFSQTKFDLIISNPPYVKNNEKSEIRSNVLAFEPHLALFVEDEDALIFYRKIAEIGLNLLTENGCILVEINSYLGKETAVLFENHGYKEVEIIKDFFGRDRFVKAKA